MAFGVKACGWQYGDTPNTEGLYVARDAEGNIEVGMWYARGANGVAANWTRQFNDLNRDDIVAWIRIPDYAPNARIEPGTHTFGETMKRHPLERIVRPQVLDVCCGPKGMWFDKHDERAVFLDRRRETHVDVYPCGTKTNVIDPDMIGDFTNIKFPDESFSLVVFDPPHIEQASESQITKKYGALTGDWREMIRAGFKECFLFPLQSLFG